MVEICKIVILPNNQRCYLGHNFINQSENNFAASRRFYVYMQKIQAKVCYISNEHLDHLDESRTKLN